MRQTAGRSSMCDAEVPHSGAGHQDLDEYYRVLRATEHATAYTHKKIAAQKMQHAVHALLPSIRSLSPRSEAFKRVGAHLAASWSHPLS